MIRKKMQFEPEESIPFSPTLSNWQGFQRKRKAGKKFKIVFSALVENTGVEPVTFPPTVKLWRISESNRRPSRTLAGRSDPLN
jgi:hypothetical protein